MRLSLFLAAAALGMVASVAAPDAARAQGRGDILWHYYDAPWCSSFDNLTECNYATLRQCLVSRSGVGGSCNRNPRYAEAPPPARRKVRRHHR